LHLVASSRRLHKPTFSNPIFQRTASLVCHAELNMSANDSFPQIGLVVAGDDENLDNMGELVFTLFHISLLFRRFPRTTNG
jgi:dsRNA-specific ribonuclease